MRVREVSEAGRYQSYYEIDIGDRTFYDLHINTARWSKAGVFNLVRTAIDEYDPNERDEGSFTTPTIDICRRDRSGLPIPVVLDRRCVVVHRHPGMPWCRIHR